MHTQYSLSDDTHTEINRRHNTQPPGKKSHSNHSLQFQLTVVISIGIGYRGAEGPINHLALEMDI